MFCKTCGNELNDKAVICPKCGCAVNNSKIGLKQITTTEDIKTAFNVLNYITIGLICLVVTFLFISIPLVYIYHERGYGGYLALDYDCLICAFVFSLCACGTGITSFVLGFKESCKTKRFLSDAFFMFVFFLFFISIFFLSVQS